MAEYFEKFGSSVFESDCALILQLRVNKEFSGEGDPVVCLHPSVEDIQNQACLFIDHMVGMGQRFPRVDARVAQALNFRSRAPEFLGPCTVAVDDEVVVQVKERIRAALREHWERPQALIQQYAEFAQLLSGEAERRVARALSERQQGKDTLRSLEALALLCRELEETTKRVRAASPDLCYFPLYMVRCHEVKELLARRVEALHATVVEAVASDNREHMLAMAAEYQEIVNKLVEEPTDSAELRALQDYCVAVRDQLGRLTDQYCACVYERVRFLLEERFRVSREDLQLFYSTYNWPYNVKMFMARSLELQTGRKKDLEMVLEGRQENLARKLQDTEKKVEKLFELGQLGPLEVQNMVKRITSIRESLEEAETEAENIEEQESLLGLELTDNMSKIREIRAALEPVEKLWMNVKEYLELAHYWSTAPLAEIDAEEAERKADELYRTLMKVAKELEKGGESRLVPRKAAQTIVGEIKMFLDEHVPLMLLLCTPGLKERHWAEIMNITGLEIAVHEGSNLAQMLDLSLHSYVAAIEETCVAASKEYGLEKAMDKMEGEWAHMRFDTKPHRNTGTSILCGIDEIQQQLDDHIVKTQAMRGNRYITPFLDRIVAWEKLLVGLQDIIDNWLKMQATWLYLEPIFSSDDIMRQMPVEGRLFRAVDNTYRRVPHHCPSSLFMHVSPLCLYCRWSPSHVPFLFV